jgi:hypothetical protein
MTLFHVIFTRMRVDFKIYFAKTRLLFRTHTRVWFQHTRAWFLHSKYDFYMQNGISTRKVWFQHVWVWFIFTESDLYTQSVIFTCKVWLRHSRVWFRHAWMVLQHTACNFKTNQTKINIRLSKNLDWFWYAACDLHTHVCDLDTLRVELLYYDTYVHKSKLQAHAWGI